LSNIAQQSIRGWPIISEKRRYNMAEAQLQNTISGTVDWFLQSLVSIVNEESANIPITLSVGGLLISVEMIGGKTYFNEFARQFKDGFRDISSKTAASIEESFKRLGDVYDPIQKESQGNAPRPNPHLVHLRDAQIYDSGGSPSPTEKGVLWRGRLEAVDGFSLGRHSLS
jgi:hypothetical protein